MLGWIGAELEWFEQDPDRARLGAALAGELAYGFGGLGAKEVTEPHIGDSPLPPPEEHQWGSPVEPDPRLRPRPLDPGHELHIPRIGEGPGPGGSPSLGGDVRQGDLGEGARRRSAAPQPGSLRDAEENTSPNGSEDLAELGEQMARKRPAPVPPKQDFSKYRPKGPPPPGLKERLDEFRRQLIAAGLVKPGWQVHKLAVGITVPNVPGAKTIITVGDPAVWDRINAGEVKLNPGERLGLRPEIGPDRKLLPESHVEGRGAHSAEEMYGALGGYTLTYPNQCEGCEGLQRDSGWIHLSPR
jgi:hypothetical protein